MLQVLHTQLSVVLCPCLSVSSYYNPLELPQAYYLYSMYSSIPSTTVSSDKPYQYLLVLAMQKVHSLDT